MKRLLSIILSIFAIAALCSCSGRELADMTTVVNVRYAAIVWEDRTYVPYCAIPKRDCGEQIGIVDGDKDNRVYEYKGYSADEWIINSYGMDSAMLLKEIDVTDIPAGLESEYEWNH